MASDGNYKHYIPDLKLSIEKNTNNVPSNNYYYVIRDGEIIEKYRTLKKAKELFDKMVKESGYKPKFDNSAQKDMYDSKLDQYFYAKEVYWAESYKYRGKSGKGGRGGV